MFSAERIRRTSLIAIPIAFTFFFYFNAYVCDDAFMAFRTVDNFVRGYGLRWNVAERVQVFTAPLHTLLMSALYWFTYDRSWLPNPDRIYWTSMLFSYGASLGGVLWLVLPAVYVAASNLAMVPLTGQNMPFLGLNSWADVVLVSGLATGIVFGLAALDVVAEEGRST